MSDRNQGGRPRKTDEKKRSYTYCMRFTREEYSQLEARRADYGYASVASLIHHRLFSRTVNTNNALPASQLLVISGIIKEVNSIGKNINQAVRKIEFLDAGSEKILLYEARKLEEMIEEVRKKEEEILAIINPSTAQFGFTPMKTFQ